MHPVFKGFPSLVRILVNQKYHNMFGNPFDSILQTAFHVCSHVGGVTPGINILLSVQFWQMLN